MSTGAHPADHRGQPACRSPATRSRSSRSGRSRWSTGTARSRWTSPSWAARARSRDIQLNSKFAQLAYDHDYTLPVPPPSPRFTVVRARHGARLLLGQRVGERLRRDQPESQGLRGLPGVHRRGPGHPGAGRPVRRRRRHHRLQHRVRRRRPARRRCSWTAVTAHYKYTIGGLRDGFKYYCAVTAYDLGNSQIDAARERPLPEPARRRARARRPASGRSRKPTVFPNPYRVEARWDQGTQRARPLPVVREPARALHAPDLHAGRATWCSRRSSTAPPTTARARAASTIPPRLARQADALGHHVRLGPDHAPGPGRRDRALPVLGRGPHAGRQDHVGKFLVVKSDREGR